MQQNGSGEYIAWGVTAKDEFMNDNGHWEIWVVSDGVLVDRKTQDYAPHGSVHPSDVKPGKILEINGTVNSGSSIGYDYRGYIRGLCKMT